jgi:hypothetical protein
MPKHMDWPQVALFCASLLGAGTAFASKEAAPLMGVLSLPLLLAATAGAGLILSFLPPQEPPATLFKVAGTIFFCAMLGEVLAPLAVRILAGYVSSIAGPGAEIAAAFMCGALGQVAMPLLIERRGELVGRLLPAKKD